MILPKGTIDFSVNGGESVMEEIVEQIRNETRTGYILVLGNLEDVEGKVEDITAQLVFQDGEPKLCEAVLNKISHKGSEGIYYLLRSMGSQDNIIEMHSKIDVGPPLAFFKDCKFETTDLDIDAFKSRIREEEEQRKKKEEERRKREEQRDQIRDEVESWISSGFTIPGFPEVMEDEHDEIVKWHSNLSNNIDRIRDMIEWVKGIDEVEVEELKEQIIEKAKEPLDMKGVEKLKGDMEAKLGDIKERRSEMEKWVNLWKDEGYNTERIEETLKADITTAWSNLTHFMDDIQRLKDYREELETIRENDEGGLFGPEIREIDLLLNDPMEIENLERIITQLKETIETEKTAKDILLEEAIVWKKKGYDIEGLKTRYGERLATFKTDHKMFLDNIKGIEKLRKDLGSLDGRDLFEEIDALMKGSTDPFSLENYQREQKGLMERIDALNSRREVIMEELGALKEEGFLVEELDKVLDSPVDQLNDLFNKLKDKIGELRELEGKISDMDHRWLEKDFTELEGKLKDPSSIDEVKAAITSLLERIDIRERERARIRKDMENWKEEGFQVSNLKEVIEDDLDTFQTVHGDFAKRIEKAKILLSTLASMNVKFFPAEAEEVGKDLHAPDLVDKAESELEGLKEKVSKDWEKRNKLKGRLDELKEKGWILGKYDNLMDTSPNLIDQNSSEMETDIKDLSGAIEDIDSWDPLESNWFSEGIEELKGHLLKIEERDRAIDHYNDLKEKVQTNHRRRGEIIEQIEEWKEAGYVIRGVSEKLESPMEELDQAYKELEDRVRSLEDLQKTFDSLKIDHFRTEAEEIEFKMNDPYLVDEISKDIDLLKAKIDEDENRRLQFQQRIDEYMKDGFTGAKKLEKVMGEDISIMDLEFKNFDKEVQLLKKYMESTGFNLPKGEPVEVETEDGEDKEAAPDEQPDVKPDEEPKEGSPDREEEVEKEVTLTENLDLMEFSNFIVDTPNEVAHKAAMEVAENPSEAYNPLLILGDAGVGKTHLINSIGNKIVKNRPSMKVIRLKGKDFIDRMMEHRKSGKMEDFRDLFRSSDVLIMDDVEELKASEDGQEMFINILNAFLDKGKQVVLAAERDIKSIPKVTEQIRARLDKGVSVDLEGTSPEMNRKLVESISGGRIPDEVSTYMSMNLIGPVTNVKTAVRMFMDEVEEGASDALERSKDIVDRITGDPGHRKLTEALADTLQTMNDKMKKLDVVLCTNCNKEIPADSAECPECGAVFEDVEMKECPDCGELVELESSDCKSCGSKF